MDLIPKRIIYAWFGNNPYPGSFIKLKKTWLANNPGYEIMEVNENNFDINQFTFTKDAYKNKKWAFVSDVARIWAVNEFGGIYLDTDVEVLKPLDLLLTNNQFWAKEDAGMVNSGLIFGSEPNEEVLKEILLLYRQTEYPSDEDLYKYSTVHLISKVLQKKVLVVENLLIR